VYVSLPHYDEKDNTYKLPPLDTITPLLNKKIAIQPTDAMDVDVDG